LNGLKSAKIVFFEIGKTLRFRAFQTFPVCCFYFGIINPDWFCSQVVDNGSIKYDWSLGELRGDRGYEALRDSGPSAREGISHKINTSQHFSLPKGR